ncbi:MAG: transposase [Deltaproteobacteria bacterium]|nr:transposase [Deltaproteobacteria bacterium]
MARIPRLHLIEPGFPTHVVLRGNNRRKLFSYPSCYATAVRYLRDAQLRTDCLLYAAAILSNHLHLVLDPPEPTALSGFVHRFSQRYAVYRNASRGGSGKLFEERFTSVPIRSDRQLAATLAYVELNPVRAGLSDDPAEHRWSTYRLHARRPGGVEPFEGLWSPCAWYETLAPSAAERGPRYAEFVRDRLQSTVDLARESLDRPSVVLGADRRPNRRRAW